jgi:hypothetical protein
MVIKPDINKSIFNSIRNMAFFQQAHKQNDDVIVITKENRGNYNTYNNFYKQTNLLNKKEKESDDDECENKSNIRQKIDKDYNNSINTINKLITLDAKIKTENIKHIDNFIKDDNNNINKNNENNKVNNYINEENNDNINNNENLKNYIYNNTNLINILLTEVRALSNKQISLLDLIDEIQANTEQHIEDLNQKIVDLDTTVKDLNHQLYILQKE